MNSEQVAANINVFASSSLPPSPPSLPPSLPHPPQHSVIDEPVEYGVGIVADTDNWTVKVVAASKSVQTSDVIFGSGPVQGAKCVRQMLSSVRSMHCMRMPPEFVSGLCVI